MKNHKRALRRHHNARLLCRAKEKIQIWSAYLYRSAEYYHTAEETLLKWARRRRDNMQICSCASCGNWRRSGWNSARERLTLAERKAEDSYRDALEDFLTLENNVKEE